MSCSNANNTLDPFKNIIDIASKSITTLENQALLIVPFVQEFTTLATSIVPSIPSDFNDVIDGFTADTICATSTVLGPINDLTSDCFNEAAKSVKKFLNDILDIIGDSMSLINGVLLLPENIIMSLMQKVKSLCSKVKNLIQGIDIKLQCIPIGEQYDEQVEVLNTRINDVVDELGLEADGSFSVDCLMSGISNPHIDQLKNNMIALNEKTESLEQEIKDNISSTVDLTTTVNPKNYF